MAQKKPVVEIIPWPHHLGHEGTEDVIRYIKTLPKNSSLALEISSGGFGASGKVEDLIVGRNPNLRGLEHKYRPIIRELRDIMPLSVFDLRERALLSFEIINECRKRNIDIVPLDTAVSAFGADKREYNNMTKELEAHNRFRDANFARQIQAHLWNFSGKKFPVIVGSAHATELKGNLGKIGVFAKVNTNLFTHKERQDALLRLYPKFRRAIYADKLDEAARIDQKIRPLEELGFSRGGPQQNIAVRIDQAKQAAAMRLLEYLSAKAARPARKLAQRKQKLAVRLARQQRRK